MIKTVNEPTQILHRARGLILNPTTHQALLMYRIKNGQQYYTLCGGKVENNETPQEGCLREIFEETALQVEIVKELFSVDDMHDGILNRHHVFLCHYIDGEARLNGEELERLSATNHYEPQWVNISDLKKLDIKPDIIANSLHKHF